MSVETILSILKRLLPTKKISAYVLSVIVAILAVILGVDSQSLKDEYCKSSYEVPIGKEK